MASDITVKVGVDGEKEFKASLKEINQQLKECDSELKLAAESMGEMTNAEGEVVSQSDALANKIELQAQKIELLQERYNEAAERQRELNEAWQQAIAENGENSEQAERAAAAYQKQSTEVSRLGTQLNNAKADMAGTQKELNGTGDAMNELNKIVSGKLGVNVGDLGAKFSSLTGISAAAAVGVAAIGAAFVKVAHETSEAIDAAAEYTDTMNTLSKTAEVDVKTLQAWGYAADFLDVSLSTMTTSLKKTTKAMGEAESGSSAYVEAFDELGINIYTASGQLRDSEDVFYDIIDALGKQENAAHRDALAQKLLGKSYNELNPLIEAGSDALGEYRKKAEEVGYILNDDVNANLQSVQDKQDELARATEAFSNQWGGLWAGVKETVLDARIHVTENLSGMIAAFNDWGSVWGEGWSVLKNAGFSGYSAWVNNLGNDSDKVWTMADASGELATNEEAAAEGAIVMADALQAGEDKFTTWAKAGTDAATSTYEANVAMNGIRDSISNTTATGSDLWALYEKLQAEYDALEGSGTEWNKQLTQEQLNGLKLTALYSSLTEELPGVANSMSVTMEGIAATLYGSGVTAQEWAGWYNDAFSQITSGFETLKVETENTLDAWVDSMTKNTAITNAWTGNTRIVLDQANAMAQQGDTALRDAVNIMMEGGVEEYGTAMQQLATAISTGDTQAISQITSAVTGAGEAALHAAAAQFMAAETLTEAQLQEYINNGKVILNDGSYEWAASAEEAASGIADGIANAADSTQAAADSVVQIATDAISSGGVQAAWQAGGEQLGSYLATGLSASLPQAVSSVTAMVGDIVNAASSAAQSQAVTVGVMFDRGFANGIMSNQGLVYNAAYKVAQQASTAAGKAIKIGSPSKLMYQYGQWFDEGFINGMQSLQNKVASAAAMVTAKAGGAAGDTVRNNTVNASYNITVNAANGQNEQQIAQAVMAQLNSNIKRQRGVRA